MAINKNDLPKEYREIHDGALTFFDRGGHHVYKGNNDLVTVSPELLKDWDWKNVRKPWQYTSNSHEKLNWICNVCNRNWIASVDSRSNGSGCPYCARNSSMPELMLYQYLIHNGLDCDEQVPIGRFKADLIVSDALIEYNGNAFHNTLINIEKLNAAINYGIRKFIIISETISNSKDVCVLKHQLENILVYEIVYNTLSKSSISNFSNLLIVLDKLLNSIDIATNHYLNTDEFFNIAYKNKGLARRSIKMLPKHVMDEYCYDENPNPDTVYVGSTHKLKWMCSKCNTVYEASPLNKQRGDMCPVCSNHRFVPGINDLLTKCPELSAELISHDPRLIFYNSVEKVTWLCKNCHNTWESRVKDRSVLDASCKVCGYTLLYKDRTLLYDFNSISTKYNIEYFTYKGSIIKGITNEKELLSYIIEKLLNTKFKELLINNQYVTGIDCNLNKEFFVSRSKAKQKVSRLFELLGEDVNNIKIKPEEFFYDDF